jgi:histidine triad (HIT) family protein
MKLQTRAAFLATMSCLFCKLAAGEIPSEKVMENDGAFAFLDIKPLRRGHILVVPKRHAERFADMRLEDARSVMDLAQRIAARQRERLDAEGVTIAVNDGRAAGQEVMHVHVHLVPRAEADGHGPIHRLFAGEKTELREGELQEIGARLRA